MKHTTKPLPPKANWWRRAAAGARGALGRFAAKPAESTAIPRPRMLDCMELEDRVLFSAAPMAMAIAPGHHVPMVGGNASFGHVQPLGPQAGPAAQPSNIAAGAAVQPADHELVIIDANVPDAALLVKSVQALDDPSRRIDVAVVSDNGAGIDQISKLLSQYQDLTAVHFISHGTDQSVDLGGTWLQTANLAANSAEIAGWKAALAPGADLLFYGCDLASGAAGQQVLAAIRGLTGANVAANTNATGNPLLGGDWTLEYQLGSIHTALPFNTALLNAWDGLLDTFVVTTTADSGPGSLRNAIQESNSTPGLNTITFDIPGSGVQTINLLSALPSITDPVDIDATSQPGYAGTPLIDLNGAAAGAGVNALTLDAGSSGSTIRGLTINSFSARAILVTNGSANDTIAGNFLGTSASGLAAQGNGSWGIDLNGAGSGIVVGGTTTADRNVISASPEGGLALNGTSVTDTLIEGNDIGVGADGTTALGNGGYGGILILSGSSGNTIGGTVAGAGNIIADNNATGIQIWNNSSSSAILGNSIFGNASLGIDLNADGVTPNGVGARTGPNDLQNYPVLAHAATDGAGNVWVDGSLNSLANTTYRIEFFSNAAADPSGYGQGQTYLGCINVTTNGSGNASFGTTLSALVAANAKISATATDLTTNDTSEFAQDITAITGSLTVTTTNDTINGNTTSVLSLIADPGADGISLCEAITAADNTTSASPIPITFDIPGSGAQTISLQSALPAITNPVILDATSQPGYTGTPLIQLQGTSNPYNGFTVSANNVTIEGFSIYGFSSGNGIQIDAVSGTVVQADYLGLTASDTAGANGTGIVLKGATNAVIGGTTAAQGNVISGNANGGMRLESGASGNVIEGNYIGTDPTGTASQSNGWDGIRITGGANNTIGGTAAGAGNVISGNSGPGIEITGTASTSNVVAGNFIGTNAAGTAAVPNSTSGVSVESGADGNLIGGTTAGDGNLIEFNAAAGVAIYDATTTNDAVLGNRISQNGGLGIDLGNDGVTLNHDGGVVAGPNGLQNFPVLSSVSTSAGNTTFTGRLNSSADTTYRIEFFDNAGSGDPSGYGQGAVYLGATSVTTDASGNAAFTAVLPVTTAVGDAISATATVALGGGSYGSTSEFAQNLGSGVVNNRPVTNLPGTQTIMENTSLVFSSSNGDQISVADSDSRGYPEQVSLAVLNGTLTLSGTTGLTFSSGTGTGDASMQFTGTITDINNALNGLTYTPAANFSGTDGLGVTINDLGNTGAGGPQSASGSVSITVKQAPPTVATPAAATPSSVTGTTANLSVLGADDGGESNLTYTWAATGTPPAPVSFSANDSNAAKNTTATFSQAGNYSLQVTITDAGGLSATSTVNVTVNQTLTSIAVTPGTATLVENGKQQFTAVGYDQFGQVLASQPAFTWSQVSGVGSVSAAGLYTAPPRPAWPRSPPAAAASAARPPLRSTTLFRRWPRRPRPRLRRSPARRPIFRCWGRMTAARAT